MRFGRPSSLSLNYFVWQSPWQLIITIAVLSAFSLWSVPIVAQTTWPELNSGYRQNVDKLYLTPFKIEWVTSSETGAEFQKLAPDYHRALVELEKEIEGDHERTRSVRSLASTFVSNTNVVGEFNHRYILQNCEQGFRIWRTAPDDFVWEFPANSLEHSLDADFGFFSLTTDLEQKVLFTLSRNGGNSQLSIMSLTKKSASELIRNVESPFPGPMHGQLKLLDSELEDFFPTSGEFPAWVSNDQVSIELEGSIAKVSINEIPVQLVYTDSTLKRGLRAYLEIDTKRGFLPVVIKTSTRLRDGTGDIADSEIWQSETALEIATTDDGAFYPCQITSHKNIALQPVDKFAEFLREVDPLDAPMINVARTRDQFEHVVAKVVLSVDVSKFERWHPDNLDQFFSVDQVPQTSVDEFYNAITGEFKQHTKSTIR